MTEIPVPRRHLSAEMRALRKDAGLSAEAVAAEMGWNRAKVHRIENAKTQTVKASDIRALCDLYQVGEDRKEAMLALAKRASNPGWWYEYSDLIPGSYLSLESEAEEMRTFEVCLVPGLLQTQDYATALLQASGITDDHEIRRRLQARAVRQRVLDRAQPPQIWAVIDEAVLRRPIGGTDTMRAQIARLIELSHHAFLDLQVLPLAKGAHAGLNGHFVILDFAEAPSMVYVEAVPDGLYLDKQDIVKRYSLRFKRVQASALDTQESLNFLTRLHDEPAK